MSGLEKQNENHDEQKFEKEFSEELKNGWEDFDKKAFWDLISGTKFDDNKSKEENIQWAFNEKVDSMIQTNLKNLPEEKKEELKNLQKKAYEWKDTKSLLNAYKEIKQSLDDRHAESKKWEHDIHREKAQKEQEIVKEKSQDFLEELKKGISENAQKEQEKRQEMKNMLAENQEKMNQEKAWAEWVLDWFPESSQQA